MPFRRHRTGNERIETMNTKTITDFIEFDEKSLTKRIIHSDANILTFVLNFQPGHQLPVHKHETSTLIALVLDGSCDIQINDEVKTIRKGDVVQADGPDDFSIPVVHEPLSLFVNIGPNPTDEIYSKNFG